MNISLALIAAAVPNVQPPVISVPPPAIVTPAPLLSPAPARALFERTVPPVPVQPLPQLLSTMDYPQSAIRDNQQGTVAVALTVSAEGRVTGCAVEQSSGSAVLDLSTCRLMRMRARFTPARDASGVPVEGATRTRIRWVLPALEVPVTAWSSSTRFSLVDGGLRSCAEERTADAPLFMNNCRLPDLMELAQTFAAGTPPGVEARFVALVRMTPAGKPEGTTPVGEQLLRLVGEHVINPDGTLASCKPLTAEVKGLPQDRVVASCGPLVGKRNTITYTKISGPRPVRATLEMMLLRLP